MTSNYFFSSGSYGCTHYPSIKCDGKQSSQENGRYISKLTAYDKIAKNEYLIGKKIKKLQKKSENDENERMIVVEKKCKIKKRHVKRVTKKYEDCNKIVEKKRSKQYVLLFSKYFESVTASSYIGNDTCFPRIFRVYFFGIETADYLYQEKRVVHMDLHFNNIIYDTKDKFHMIDFGLAFDVDKVKNRKNKINYGYLQQIFSRYVTKPKRVSLPIEVHILSFFLHEKRKLDSQTLSAIIDNYYDALFLSTNALKLFFGDLDSYTHSAYNYYDKKFINDENIENHIMELVTNSAHTWDIFCVTRFIIKWLRKIEKYENDEEEDDVVEFKKLILKSLDYDYEKRPKAQTLLNNKLISRLHLQFQNNTTN